MEGSLIGLCVMRRQDRRIFSRCLQRAAVFPVITWTAAEWAANDWRSSIRRAIVTSIGIPTVERAGSSQSRATRSGGSSPDSLFHAMAVAVMRREFASSIASILGSRTTFTVQ